MRSSSPKVGHRPVISSPFSPLLSIPPTAYVSTPPPWRTSTCPDASCSAPPMLQTYHIWVSAKGVGFPTPVTIPCPAHGGERILPGGRSNSLPSLGTLHWVWNVECHPREVDPLNMGIFWGVGGWWVPLRFHPPPLFLTWLWFSRYLVASSVFHLG